MQKILNRGKNGLGLCMLLVSKLLTSFLDLHDLSFLSKFNS